MNLKLALIGAVGALSLTATAANAVVVNLNSSGSSANAFYITDLDFTLPTNFTNAVLNITFFEADDRAVVQLNGATVDQTGIFAPGSGFFNFGSGNVAWAYSLPQGARNINVTSGFMAGNNDFRVIVNDTHAGIGGDVAGGTGNLNGLATGPTGYSLQATLSYDLVQAGVPEPATWALMIGGFGLAGTALRSRRRVGSVA
ncbi:MAG: PEP-CTERM sorting domain-containing protein [Phenylobacterium sp.]|uniref:PEPxxWA-CTERM sorting domain-containing protein n=1 Tax=Phenylobacterium sp. TaxID=1871053 RepID=UPI001A58C53C|nr:PEPxxWA-CTERM sorting domain-containing protein [Phenylobacterium sp.]MBL8771108.1 PEP-CTERM sorting domain-containing protein [Phenylobacterium sp.]